MKFPFDMEKAITGLAKVTLRGGVVGKVTFLVAFVALAVALINWAVKNVWVGAVSVLLLFCLAFVAMWRLISFADRHPQAALLEGAEFLVHEQIVHASKGNPAINVDMVEKVQPEPILGNDSDLEQARLPDPDVGEVPPQIEGKD